MKKLQRATLIIFLAAMIICASLVLFLAWSVPQEFTVVNRFAISSFVVGLASFLVWFVTMVLEIRNNVRK